MFLLLFLFIALIYIYRYRGKLSSEERKLPSERPSSNLRVATAILFQNERGIEKLFLRLSFSVICPFDKKKVTRTFRRRSLCSNAGAKCKVILIIDRKRCPQSRTLALDRRNEDNRENRPTISRWQKYYFE